MKVKKGRKIIGSWAITTHCIHRYRERVKDDPALNRGHRNATDIRRLLRLFLNKTDDIATLPKLCDAYIYEVQLFPKGNKYYLVIPQYQPYVVVSLLDEEMYQQDLRRGAISI